NNSGTIELNSAGSLTSLEIIGNGMTLTGHGQVEMSDSDANAISGTSPSVVLTNIDNTISGAGKLGAGSLTLVNEGTIDADATHALEIDTGDNSITNSGTLEASNGGSLVIKSALDNIGTLWAHGGQ